MTAAVMILDPDNEHLRLGAAPSLPAAFAKAIDRLEVGTKSGSAANVRAEVAQKLLDLKVEFCPGPALGECDPVRLQQIF